MKTEHYRLIDAIKVLNPADEVANKRIKELCLRQRNGDSVFVDAVLVEQTEGMIYARASGRAVWHMLPVSELVGFEAELRNAKDTWHKDALTLPAIIRKLQGEQQGRLAA